MISIDITLKDLEKLRVFMKKKNISLVQLSIEMDYSAGHVGKVFSGNWEIHRKFTRSLLIAFQNILNKDFKHLTLKQLKKL